MELQRTWTLLRDRWRTVVTTALVVALLLGGGMVLKQVTSNDARYSGRVLVTGQVLERERYVFDARPVAHDIAAEAVSRATTEGALIALRERLAPSVPIKDLNSVFQMDVAENSGTIEIIIDDLGRLDGVALLTGVETELAELATDLAAERFVGDPPITVTVQRLGVLESALPAGDATIVLGVLLVALLAGVGAALVRAGLDSRVRYRSDLADLEATGAVLVDGRRSTDLALDVRAQLRASTADGIVVVTGGAASPHLASDLADALDAGGQSVALMLLRARSDADRPVVDVLALLDGTAAATGDASGVTVVAPLDALAAERRLSPAAVRVATSRLRETHDVVVVDCDDASRSTVASAFLAVATDAVVAIARGEATRAGLIETYRTVESSGANPILVLI